jgi:energy-coupling factor transport system ATP-binding protein
MIELKNVDFKYEEKLVLKNISLKIGDNGYTAIIGANGSGKTTLAKLLNALILPNNGTVTVDGIPTKKNQDKVREKVGFVFQNPEDQLIYSIVEEDIAFGLENLGIETKQMKLRVKKIMKSFGMEKLAKTNVNVLSFGQKQLAALAGVLVMEPKYIVFDEPTAMLDPNNKKRIMEQIKGLHNKGMGIILVTNVLGDTKDSNNIVLLDKGTVIFSGNKSKLRKKTLQRAGLYA